MSFVLVSEVRVPVESVPFPTFFAFFAATFNWFLLIDNSRGDSFSYPFLELPKVL